MYTVALHLIQINSLRMTASPGNKGGEQDAASGDDDVKFEDLMDRPFADDPSRDERHGEIGDASRTVIDACGPASGPRKLRSHHGEAKLYNAAGGPGQGGEQGGQDGGGQGGSAGGQSSPVINQLKVEVSQQVNIQVRVVEVSRSLTHSLGFNWGAVLNTGRGPLFLGNGTSQGLFSTHAANNSHFNPDGSFEDGNANIPGLMPDSNTAGAALGGIFNMGRMSLGVLINAMSESGFASLLAEPNLTAMSGQPAAFASGGEVPIVIITGNSITIDYKSWGVILRMTPTVLSPNRIAIHVAPEVSELTSEGQVILSEGSVIPAVRVRRAETTVELASGQSFALAGMLRSESSQTVNGVPGLRNLPFVGRLFEYEQTQVEDSELVILLTANIVDPVSSGDLRVPGRGINAVDAYAPRQASIGYLF